MHTKSIGLGVVVALLGVLVIVGASGANDGRPLSGAELYRQLTEAARGGDERAAEYKRLLDEHLSRGGLRVADLTLPAEATSGQAQGHLQLGVRNSAPWGITISNRTPIDTPEALAQYREARHAALTALAATDAARDIVVVASPARSISIPEFVTALSCPCTAEQLIVDVYDGDGGWLMSSGRDLTGQGIPADPSAIEAAVLEQASFSADQFPGVDPAALFARVRSVRLTLSAEKALAISGHPDLLVMDPLTDIADAYAHQAALVTIHNPPDAWEAHARLVLGEPIDRNFVQPAGE